MVDRDGLENRCAFTGTVGSNPTPSANLLHQPIQFRADARNEATVAQEHLGDIILFGG